MSSFSYVSSYFSSSFLSFPSISVNLRAASAAAVVLGATIRATSLVVVAFSAERSGDELKATFPRTEHAAPARSFQSAGAPPKMHGQNRDARAAETKGGEGDREGAQLGMRGLELR